MLRCLFLMVFFFLLIVARGQGVRFGEFTGWDEVVNTAKKEHKYILVDCFATWCAPCQLMDREVFTKPAVGEFINVHFIPVKVQMDTTEKDRRLIKDWYAAAGKIRKEYSVESFPTYLFFSPDGKIVHRFSGALNDTNFLRLAANALDTNKQYYILLKKYRRGDNVLKSLPNMAGIALSLGDKRQADVMARDYIENYLDKKGAKEPLSKWELQFVSQQFIGQLHSNDRVFSLFLREGQRVDSIMGKQGYSMDVVCEIINREEVDPRIWPHGKAIDATPAWEVLEKDIAEKFGAGYAERTVLDAKIRWYNEKAEWPKASKYTIQKIERFGLDTIGIRKYFTNNTLYEVVFKHSNNRDELSKAARWMRTIVDMTPEDAENLDTYANLLYKLGRVKDALSFEEKAAALRPDNEDIQTSLKKMKRGQPTW